MHFDVGQYRMTLPTSGVVLGPKIFSPSRVPSTTARLGPFEISAHTSDGKLEEWREFVNYQTRLQTPIQAIEINGISGLTLPENDQRLDYVFLAPGCDRIEIVAWSDTPTSPDERLLVKETIRTLCVRSESSENG